MAAGLKEVCAGMTVAVTGLYPHLLKQLHFFRTKIETVCGRLCEI